MRLGLLLLAVPHNKLAVLFEGHLVDIKIIQIQAIDIIVLVLANPDQFQAVLDFGIQAKRAIVLLLFLLLLYFFKLLLLLKVFQKGLKVELSDFWLLYGLLFFLLKLDLFLRFGDVDIAFGSIVLYD